MINVLKELSVLVLDFGMENWLFLLLKALVTFLFTKLVLYVWTCIKSHIERLISKRRPTDPINFVPMRKRRY
ncbi:hypothetical protein CSE15_16385 [Bacillus altitudinis]|nr:hypothetical protein CSE15_16385 [Bacillus altitudinis]